MLATFSRLQLKKLHLSSKGEKFRHQEMEQNKREEIRCRNEDCVT